MSRPLTSPLPSPSRPRRATGPSPRTWRWWAKSASAASCAAWASSRGGSTRPPSSASPACSSPRPSRASSSIRPPGCRCWAHARSRGAGDGAGGGRMQRMKADKTDDRWQACFHCSNLPFMVIYPHGICELIRVVSDEPIFETGLLLAGNVRLGDVRKQLSRWTRRASSTSCAAACMRWRHRFRRSSPIHLRSPITWRMALTSVASLHLPSMISSLNTRRSQRASLPAAPADGTRHWAAIRISASRSSCCMAIA